MIRYCLVAVAAACAATPASAQDEPAKAEPADFTGPRVEAVAGYDEGLVYGVGAGYDVQAGRAVFGIEGEVTDSTSNECIADAFIAGDRFCARSDRDIYVGGRIGFVVAPRILLYGKAGYTNLKGKFTYEDGTAGTAQDFRYSDKLDGVRVGGGLQLGLGARSYIKAEYRYSDYEGGGRKHDGIVGLGLRF